MMIVACSDNDDQSSGDMPVPPESYETVLNYFKEINAVPRPSRHEDKMREYLRGFAQARGLRLVEDNGNIIIYKDATTGMENIPMVCLQTHMDMVCVAADGYDIDFLTQGIEQYNDGQFIWSKDRKTSLGADDGICTVNYYVRGFNDEKMDGVADSIEQAYEVGTSPAVSDRYSSYSAWTADLNSSLMRMAREVWKSLFGTEMQLVRVGGGMETSNFAVSYPSMQIFTFGPNVYDAHTINEHVEIGSIEHAWEYTLELLKNIY